MADDFEALLEAEVAPLVLGELMTTEYAKDSDAAGILQAWTALKYVKEQIESRMETLRMILLDKAEAEGKETEQKGQRLDLPEGSFVIRERRVDKLPNEDGLRALMIKADLSLDKAWSKQTVVTLDLSKVENLISLGHLDKEAVESLKKVQWALRVKSSPDLLDAVERAFADEVLMEGAPRAKRAKSKGRRK